MQLLECFNQAVSINVYKNGEAERYTCNQEPFNEILAEWNSLILNARQSPAFGVSLNNETVTAILSGVWVEFSFSNVLEVDGMPFEKLLIEIKEEYTGFNVIRYVTGLGYDGRCFYLDLYNKNMSTLYQILLNI